MDEQRHGRVQVVVEEKEELCVTSRTGRKGSQAGIIAANI